MRLYLIRHAATTGQAPNAPLSAEGEAQARDLVPVLQRLKPTHLFSSPYARAVQTVAPFAQAAAVSVDLVQSLAERRLSSAPLSDWRDHIRRSYQDRAYAPEGGESLNDVCTRARLALDHICQTGGACPLAVTHGQWLSALFSSLDPDFGFDDWQGLRNPDLFELSFKDGAPARFCRIEV